MSTALIAITQTKIDEQEVNAVDARELWEGLESKRKFGDWLKAKVLENDDFIENEDYILLHNSVKQVHHGGSNRKDYALTLDTAKEVAMMERTDKGKEVRRYFIRCEKELKAKSVSKLDIDSIQKKLILLTDITNFRAPTDDLTYSIQKELYAECGINYPPPEDVKKSISAKPVNTTNSFSAMKLLNKFKYKNRINTFNQAMKNNKMLLSGAYTNSTGSIVRIKTLIDDGLYYGYNSQETPQNTPCMPLYYEHYFQELYTTLFPDFN